MRTAYQRYNRKRVKDLHAQEMRRMGDEAMKSPKGERVARFIGLLDEYKAKQKEAKEKGKQ